MHHEKRQQCQSVRKYATTTRWRHLFVGGVAAMALSLAIGESAEAGDGPTRVSQPRPVLVELSGWQIFAQRVSRHGAELRFEGVQATRLAGESGADGWKMAAERVHISMSASSDRQINWLWARGKVRLSGPDDLYVMAEQMVSVAPARRLVFVGGEEPAASTVSRQQLIAARIEVDLATGHQSLEDLGPATRSARRKM